jgi:hypothetical protein
MLDNLKIDKEVKVVYRSDVVITAEESGTTDYRYKERDISFTQAFRDDLTNSCHNSGQGLQGRLAQKSWRHFPFRRNFSRQDSYASFSGTSVLKKSATTLSLPSMYCSSGWSSVILTCSLLRVLAWADDNLHIGL